MGAEQSKEVVIPVAPQASSQIMDKHAEAFQEYEQQVNAAKARYREA